MATYKLSRHKTYRRRHECGLLNDTAARGVKSHSAADLAAIAAQSSVVPHKIETGKRVVSDKQAFLALHATDEYRFASRNFLGEIEAKLGMKPSQVPNVVVDDRTDEEREAERKITLRRKWGRYWARKRRQD